MTAEELCRRACAPGDRAAKPLLHEVGEGSAGLGEASGASASVTTTVDHGGAASDEDHKPECRDLRAAIALADEA